MNQSFEAARDISEHLLNVTGRAILENSVDAFSPCFKLPTELQTMEGRCVLKTIDELSRVFYAVCRHYAKIGVTDMVRRCVEAEFKNPNTVLAMHETRLITGNIITRDPFATLSTLEYDGTEWRISGCSYAIDDQQGLNAALMSAGDDCPTSPPINFPIR